MCYNQSMAKPGKHETAVCERCHKSYRQSRSDQRFCSRGCGRQAWRAARATAPELSSCDLCGNQFLKLGPAHRFCSLNCGKQYWENKKRTARAGGPGKGWAKGKQIGPSNPTWRGDGAGYQALHIRVYVARGRPFPCSSCGSADESRTFDWANLSGRFADPSDYAPMCRSCHRKYDNRRKRESTHPRR